MLLSTKYIKINQKTRNFPLDKMEVLLKIKSLESKIDELNSTLDYIRTQIHELDNNIIKTLEHKIEILQYDLEYLYLSNYPKHGEIHQ